MLNPGYYENSRAGGIGVLEVVDGTTSQEHAPRLFVPLKRTMLQGEVTGPLAALRLVQVYGYTRAQCDKVLEAVYRFPLPGDAAVTGVRVHFGDVEVIAELQARSQAETAYEEAKQQGQQAALLTRESPDVFTLQVAGLRPDEDVVVETTYVQLARPQGAGWSLRIPLTTAPRYVRDDELTARYAHGQPLAVMRDPGHRFVLDLEIEGAGEVVSPTHALTVTPRDGRQQVRLRDGEVVPDRDCLLAWHPAQVAAAPALPVWTHRDPGADHLYFLALVIPPAAVPDGGVLPRESIVLVDHSGSMEGPKWDAADWAVKKFLYGMQERDTFALCLFHSITRWYGRAPQAADPPLVEDAVRFLEAHRDSGGTNLGVALEQAIDQPRAQDARARNILIITDAEVTDEGRILRLAEEEYRRHARRRISVLCIDAAPNSFLAQELAERGGGTAIFLTSNPDEEDISSALDETLAEWERPIYSGLCLEVNRPSAQVSGHTVSAGRHGGSDIDLGDLPAGRPRWIVGRVPCGEDTLVLQLHAGSSTLLARGEAAITAATHPALKALFGARRVLALEFLMHAGFDREEVREQLQRLGYDPQRVLTGAVGRKKVYAENEREDVSGALRDLLVREALEYGLASAETAFVAIRREAGTVVEGTVAVANALPSGWSEGFTGSYMAPASAGACPPMVQACCAMSSPPMNFANVAPRGRKSKEYRVFDGVPVVSGQEAVLFDSTRPQQARVLPEEMMITRLQMEWHGALPAGGVDPDVLVLLYVDDPAEPRARVRLADLLRQGGERPLNLQRRGGQLVRLVLCDPHGTWAQGGPRLTISLA